MVMKYYVGIIFGGRLVNFVKRWHAMLGKNVKRLSTLLFAA
jgi:hypothetical protein